MFMLCGFRVFGLCIIGLGLRVFLSRPDSGLECSGLVAVVVAEVVAARCTTSTVAVAVALVAVALAAAETS